MTHPVLLMGEGDDAGFWVSDMQWVQLPPLLPNRVPRVVDRLVISGIIGILQSGGRWIDGSIEYGPRKTLYNRFVGWSAKGVWQELFETLAAVGGPRAEVLLDSTYVKAHCCAGGGKRARNRRNWYQP